MRIICLLFAVFAIFMPAVPVHADMGIGGYSRPQNGVPLRIFGPDVNGTGAASYEMSGPAMGLLDTQWVTYEPNERLLYVSDFYGRAIRVHPAFATGNVAPLRVINPPVLSQTRANALGVRPRRTRRHHHQPLHRHLSAARRRRRGRAPSHDPLGGGADSTTQLNLPLR